MKMKAMPSLHGAISKTSFEFSILFTAIVYQFSGNLLPMVKLILQGDVAGKMDFGHERAETLHICKPALSTNGGGYFIEVQFSK